MVVAVAFRESPEGEVALRTAVDQARLRGAELAVLQVLDIEDPQLWDAERQAAEERLTEHLAGVDDVSWRLVAGIEGAGGAHALLDLAAEAGAELLVIGTRKRSAAGKLLMGSTVQRVLLDAAIPVLVVKTDS